MLDNYYLLGIIAFIIGNITISVAICGILVKSINKIKKIPDEYEPIKNALLSFALSIVYHHEIKGNNHNYDEFDGTILPRLSGSDYVNALFMYIHEPSNQHMRSKFNAIQRFMHLNIAHIDNQEDFMHRFIECIYDMLEESKSGESIFDDSVSTTAINDTDTSSGLRIRKSSVTIEE